MINELTSNAIQNGSITTNKIADNAITVEKLSFEIPVIPKITSVVVCDDNFITLDDIDLPTSGGFIRALGGPFAPGCNALIGNVSAAAITRVSLSEIIVQTPSMPAGTYSLTVSNPNGAYSTKLSAINFSQAPLWVTPTNLPSDYESVNLNYQFNASSNSAVTYKVATGSILPIGLTLTANGVLQGSTPGVTSPTVYNFGVVATDAELQDSTKTFSKQIIPDLVSWLLPLSGTIYTVYANATISNIALNANSATGKNITYFSNSLPTGLSIAGNAITGIPAIVGNTTSTILATSDITNKSSTTQISFVVQQLIIQYLIIAGGGAGGSDAGGGGGAGGMRAGSMNLTLNQALGVTVGAGGAYNGIGNNGNNGANSVFSNLTAIGGGGGGHWQNVGGYNGGSGGGGGWSSGPPGAGIAGQGNSGGSSWGGGGGAGSAGGSGEGGAGGAGLLNSITGSQVYYAGGGGGGAYSGGTLNNGGIGGGGRGAGGAYYDGTKYSTDGLVNTGGGGGGGGGTNYGAGLGASGGSGIVILAVSAQCTAAFSAGLAYSLDAAAVPGYKIYSVTAGTGTVTFT